MGISRRAVLLGGAGLVGAAGTYGALTPRGRRLLGWTGPDGVVPDVPPVPVQPTPWGAWMGSSGPVVLVLHGRGGSVEWWQDLGLLDIASRQPLKAVAAISPALFPSWEDAQRIDGFASREVWEAHEPLRHRERIKSPVGVWCGQEDPFHEPARELAAAVGAQGSFEHGEHDAGYWRRVLPEALRFIGDRL